MRHSWNQVKDFDSKYPKVTNQKKNFLKTKKSFFQKKKDSTENELKMIWSDEFLIKSLIKLIDI